MNRTGRIVVGVLLGLGLAGAGFYHAPAPDRELVVARWAWSSTAVPVEPGLHWRLPLLVLIARYPAGGFEVSFSMDDGGRGLESREGAGVRVFLKAALRPDPQGISSLDAALGRGYDDPGLLREKLEPAVRQAVEGLPYDGLLAGDPGPARVLEEAVASGLGRLGLAVDSIGELSGWPNIPMGSEQDSAGERKVLLVGLDGADWKILDPLMERGAMPHLSRLVTGGVRARLRTITPMLSPIIWTSMATGKRPEKHGILDFLAVDSRTGRQMPVTSTMRTARAFWKILSGRGISVGTVGWWATWPAEEVLGYQVTDRVAYQLFGPGARGEGLQGRTWPEGLILSLAPEIREAEARAEEDLLELLGRPPDPEIQDEMALRQILLSTRTYHHSALRLIREYRPRVAAVYYEGTDTVAHLFMKYAPPRLPGVDPRDVERWGGVVERFYLLQDRLLGELLEAAGEDRVVMVVSDHGFKSGPTRPQTDPRIGVGMAADWHRKFGILAVSGPGIPSGSTLSDVSVLDITPTLLALVGLPTARDMDGRVIDAILGEAEAAPIASYEGEEAPGGGAAGPLDPVSEAVEAEIIQKLTTLGYLGQTTPNASNNAGITLLQQGRAAEAEQAFRQAWAKDPSFLPARLNIARALMVSGSMDEALRELRAVQAADPDLPDVENLIGNVLMETDDVAGAESTFRKALDRDPRNPHLWNSLGIVLARRGKTDEALEAYGRVEAIDSDYAEAINNAGLIYREQRQFDRAVGEFGRAIQADPAFPGSYNNLGLVHQDQGDLEAALSAYRLGLEVDPENAVIWNNLGSALLAMDRREEARDAFEQAVEEDPEYASAHNNLGAALGMLGDLDGELDEYLKAIDLEPGYMDARLNLSLNLIRAGRLREATRSLRQLLEMDPQSARGRLELGITLARLGEEDEGLGILEALKKSSPGWPVPRNALARLHLAAGRGLQAAREARASLQLNPDQPAIRALAEQAEASSGD